jgi:hypothetical protein
VSLITVSLTLAVGSVASAHHSAAASYDADRSIEITGRVLEFAWRNPHCHLYLDVTAGPFKGKKYAVEMSSPEVLAESGWTRTLLRPGDAVVVQVHPSRVGAPIGLCRNCSLVINGTRTTPRATGMSPNLDLVRTRLV